MGRYHWSTALWCKESLALHPSLLSNPLSEVCQLSLVLSCACLKPTAALGHLEELRSLLTQSSWEVVSPFPIIPHILRFFLRCIIPSVSEPESHWRIKRWNHNSEEPQELSVLCNSPQVLWAQQHWAQRMCCFRIDTSRNFSIQHLKVRNRNIFGFHHWLKLTWGKTMNVFL